MNKLLKNSTFLLPTYQIVNLLLQKYKLHPQKKWSQNFLINENAYLKIISACKLQRGDFVIEVGAGLGTLTAHLLQTGANVLAVEHESNMYQVLRNELGQEENLILLEKDALLLQINGLFEKNKKVTIVGNLPYQITSPLIFHFLQQKEQIKNMIFLVQKEVADRLVAKPNSSNYGALTAQVQMLAYVEKICEVSSSSFIPKPKVESAVVQFIPYVDTKVPVRNLSCYQKVVKAAFLMRRKMIHHPLSSLFSGREKEALALAGIESSRRAETVSIEEFAQIADILHEKKY